MKQEQYKYLTVLICLFMTFMLAALFMFDREVVVYGLRFTGTVLLLPVAFLIGDIVAEVYGYRIAKQLIFINLLCMPLFALLAELINILPSSNSWEFNVAYSTVICSMFLVSLFLSVGIAMGVFINSYLLVRWKILLKGNYFWIRSITSTAIGLFISTVIGFIKFMFILPQWEAVEFIAISFCYKLVCMALLSWPVALICAKLKFQKILQQKYILILILLNHNLMI